MTDQPSGTAIGMTPEERIRHQGSFAARLRGDEPHLTAVLVDDGPDHDTTHRVGSDPDDWCGCDNPEAHDGD